MAEKTYTYELVTYDLWGNPKDGFQVNDIIRVGEQITLPASVVEGPDKPLIQALKKRGWIPAGVHAASIGIEGEPEHTLYFNSVRRKDGGYMPVFELQRVEEEGQ